jgi:hypothetical protein
MPDDPRKAVHMEEGKVTVQVHISPETNRWNTYACKLVRLARELHDSLLISSLTDKEIADAGIVF